MNQAIFYLSVKTIFKVFLKSLARSVILNIPECRGNLHGRAQTSGLQRVIVQTLPAPCAELSGHQQVCRASLNGPMGLTMLMALGWAHLQAHPAGPHCWPTVFVQQMDPRQPSAMESIRWRASRRALCTQPVVCTFLSPGPTHSAAPSALVPWVHAWIRDHKGVKLRLFL